MHSTTIPLTRNWSLKFSPGTLESPVLGSPAGPPRDGRGGEGENYKFQHTGTYDPCTDMSDLIAPPGAFPHYVFWLGPFFSSGSPRSALGSMRNYKHERAPKTSTDNT